MVPTRVGWPLWRISLATIQAHAQTSSSPLWGNATLRLCADHVNNCLLCNYGYGLKPIEGSVPVWSLWIITGLTQAMIAIVIIVLNSKICPQFTPDSIEDTCLFSFQKSPKSCLVGRLATWPSLQHPVGRHYHPRLYGPPYCFGSPVFTVARHKPRIRSPWSYYLPLVLSIF